METAYTYYAKDSGGPSNYMIGASSTNAPNFKLNGYNFRVIDWSSSPEYDEDYIALVAYNDAKYSICYLFFYQEEIGYSTQIDLQVGSIPLNGPWKAESVE